MNKQIALKSLREKYSEISNEKTYGYNRDKVPKRRNNLLKVKDFSMNDYTRVVQFSKVEIALGERALEEARHKRGFLGTTNHMLIARKLLLARLRLQAVKLVMARSKFHQPNDTVSKSTTNGRITAHHIEIDAPPSSDYCYVLVIENDVKIVATRPIKPNHQGRVVFPGSMVFAHQTCDFHLKMSLYKLMLVNPPVHSWTKKIRKLWNGVELPQFELVGYKTFDMSNINQNHAFHFNDATLYIQFQITIGTGIRPMHTPLALGGMFYNTFFYSGKQAVLQDTDLKLYKTAEDLQAGKCEFVVSLFKCETCDIFENTSEILKLKTMDNNEILLYFPNKTALTLWQNAFNFAIVTGNKWKKGL